jgi:type VI protein secretion system component Hcp
MKAAMKFRIDGQWRWLVAVGGILVPGIVFGAFSVPHQFEAGTPIKASEMNANFEAIAAKLDESAEPPSAPVIGTLTLQGVASALPITKLTQSINVTWTPGTAPSKPKLSEIVVQRPAGAGTPGLNSAAVQGRSLATASIELGDLTIELSTVRLTGVAVSDARGGLPQEAINLTFGAISWTWDDGASAVRTVEFDVQNGASGAGTIDAFAFGYFPPGVAQDDAYQPISGYRHQVACATPAAGCKPIHGPLVMSKLVSAETLGELGSVLAARPAGVTLDWFADDSTVNHGVELEGGLITELAITTGDDGSLNEAIGFTYPRITWRAGNTSANWDVVAGAQF